MPKRTGGSSSSSKLSLRLSNPEARARSSGLFSSLHCNDLITGLSTISIPHEFSLQKACDVLVRNNVDCAPLMSRQGVMSGLFSFSALPAYIVQQFAHTQANREQRTVNISDFDLRRLVTNSLGPEKPASDYTSLQDCVTARPTDPLCTTARMFRRGYSYVAVYYDHGSYAGLLSPSKLLRRLLYSVSDMQHHFPGRISERFPNCCTSMPTSASQDDSVFEAVQLLYHSRSNTLPVTSTNGTLVGTVSLRDIYEIFRTKQQKMLSAKLHDFIVYINSRSNEEHSLHAAHRHSTVAHAIQKMASTRQDYLWIVDSKSKLMGVLTVRDVLSFLCAES